MSQVSNITKAVFWGTIAGAGGGLLYGTSRIFNVSNLTPSWQKGLCLLVSGVAAGLATRFAESPEAKATYFALALLV